MPLLPSCVKKSADINDILILKIPPLCGIFLYKKMRPMVKINRRILKIQWITYDALRKGLYLMRVG